MRQITVCFIDHRIPQNLTHSVHDGLNNICGMNEWKKVIADSEGLSRVTLTLVVKTFRESVFRKK